MLWDVHMHTMFSGDSEADPEDMIRAGIKEGLCGLCFTDHEDLDYPDDDVFEIDFNTYFPHMKRLRVISQKKNQQAGPEWIHGFF